MSKDTKTKKGGTDTTDSKLIGPRQEYRRTGKAPDDSDAFVTGKGGEGKPTTPARY